MANALNACLASCVICSTKKVYGDVVEKAINAPMSKQDVEKSLSKLGNTPFSLGKLEITMDENIIVRVKEILR